MAENFAKSTHLWGATMHKMLECYTLVLPKYKHFPTNAP